MPEVLYACTICGEAEASQIDLYTRKSARLKRGDHRRDQSTDAQTEQGHRWAHRSGYAVRKVWKDLASAFKAVKRSDFDKALEALAAKEVSALWCYLIDRFSRKGAEDLLKVIGKARVVFELDGLDSSEPRDRRWIINRAEEAREYSQILSQRVGDTKGDQRDAGLWISGRAPWGFTVSRDRRLAPDEEPYVCNVATRKEWTRAGLLREMFRKVAEEKASTRELARWLDMEGVPRPSGDLGWRYPVVSRMLRHPAYVGWQTVQVGSRPTVYRNEAGERVALRGQDGKGVALVSEETQRRALGVLKGLADDSPIPHTPAGQKKDTRAKHLLTGLSRCEGCGLSAPFQGRSYACGGVLGGRNCTGRASARGPLLEEFVFQKWLARLSHADKDDPILTAVSERWAARQKPEETEEETQAREALRAAEADLETLIKSRKKYKGPAERFYFQELNEATEAVEKAKAVAGKFMPVNGVVLPFLSTDREHIIAAWDAAEPSMKRDLLRLAIDRVIIKKAPHQGAKFDGPSRVVIHWAADATTEEPTSAHVTLAA
ncbi:recombinase family protein [Streptomyces scabiei]|uniref:recombinase family protein n=1 Tax=Streptomyces scabiei TaxID=1930 RepID=UPI0029B318E6|nr:recombinase family protein [Streptomyces scabiei]MDX3295149.1 recombinase family protein [Streptomyces scabiei]